MAAIYVPIHVSAGPELNRQLYELTQPDAVRDPQNASQAYCRLFVHPSIPFAVLEMPEEDTIPIHLAADPSGLVAVLEPFVAQGQITQEELDGIIGAVQMLGGQRFRPADMIPASWQQYVLTQQQAIDQGYITAGIE
jgi:hypothetical protein